MNRADLVNWLKTYTPMEMELRSYYEVNRSPAPEHEFQRIVQKYNNMGPALAADQFQRLDATVFRDSDRMTTEFEDALWLDALQDISVRKHPRYMPELKHSHKFIELAYVLHGSCRQTFFFQGGRTSETVEMGEGTLCIITPGNEHTIGVFDDSIVINILIRTSTMKRALSELVVSGQALFSFFSYTLFENSAQNFMIFDTQKNESISDLVLGMMIELCEEKPYSQRTTILMLGLLFTYLQRDCSDRIRFSEQFSAGIDYIPQVISYINYNYKDASVESIAEHFHLSRAYLSRVFKAYTQTTIIQALQQVRMEQSCRLLVSTQMSVQDIADEVGYGDVTFFIRVFKKNFDVTPLQYRKKFQTIQE